MVYNRVAKSKVEGEQTQERRKGNRERKWLILGDNFILREAAIVVEYDT